MTDHNVNDIHGFNIGFQQAMRRLEAAEISDYNKDLIKRFVSFCRKENLKLSIETDEIVIPRGTRLEEMIKELLGEKNYTERIESG